MLPEPCPAKIVTLSDIPRSTVRPKLESVSEMRRNTQSTEAQVISVNFPGPVEVSNHAPQAMSPGA